MPDYRTMFDSEYLYAFHLGGREVTLKIVKVTGGELKGEGGRKAKKPIVHFEGKEKGLAINKTNGKIIAELYGTNTDKWIGRLITIYPTTTQFGGKEVECIRVRPQVPSGKGRQAPPRDTPQEEAPREQPREELPPDADSDPDWREPGSDG